MYLYHIYTVIKKLIRCLPRTSTRTKKPNEPITIRVKDQTGEETRFKIKKSTQMSKIFKDYTQRKGAEMASLRFIHDGERIRPDETPKTLMLEDEDQIDCMLAQVGGMADDGEGVAGLAAVANNVRGNSAANSEERVEEGISLLSSKETRQRGRMSAAVAIRRRVRFSAVAAKAAATQLTNPPAAEGRLDTDAADSEPKVPAKNVPFNPYLNPQPLVPIGSTETNPKKPAATQLRTGPIPLLRTRLSMLPLMLPFHLIFLNIFKPCRTCVAV